LQVGQSIQVVDSSSKKHSGIFMSVSDTAISLRVASGEQSIQKEDVRTVKLLAQKRRARNTLVGGAMGGGIGAGVGAIIGAATYKGCAPGAFCLDIVGEGGSAGIGAAVGFLGGIITGGVVGALVPSHTTIYEAKSH
jgi:zinc transporter ZupT